MKANQQQEIQSNADFVNEDNLVFDKVQFDKIDVMTSINNITGKGYEKWITMKKENGHPQHESTPQYEYYEPEFGWRERIRQQGSLILIYGKGELFVD
ncbi:MAG: hypothetical protein EZS28_055798, partial [Streblomastix strix]